MLLWPLGQKNCNYNLPSLPHFKVKFISNWRFSSCLKPLFQSEAKCEAIHMKMIFILMHLKLVFSNKCFTLSLVLKERVFGTRKWPFRSCNQGKHRYNNRTILNYGTLTTLNVNSYGNTLIWYAASLVVNNLFVGIGYFFIYLPWTVAFFVFVFFFFFTIRSSTYLFWEGNALLHLEP